MPNYSANVLQKVTDLSALFFTPKEIAIMLELDSSFIADCHKEGADAYKAFFSGRLQAELELRTSILKLAKSGSSPAQTMALDIFNKSKAKILDR